MAVRYLDGGPPFCIRDSRHRDADILSADEVRDRDVQGAEAIETINNLSSLIGNEGRKIKVVGCG